MTAPGRFRKKPVVIYAMQYHGGNDGEIQKWASLHGSHIHTAVDGDGTHSLVIPTLEGDHRADLGDWIIQGVQNEFYPCKPDIFEQTYECATP